MADVSTLLNTVLPVLADPTVLMTLIIVASVFGSLKGWIPWRVTGLILFLGAVYAQLAEIFGPETAAAMIASNAISFVFGRFWQMLKQSSGLTLDNALKEK